MSSLLWNFGTDRGKRLSFLSLHVHKGLVYFDTNSAFTESDDKQDCITRNAEWRDQFLSVGRPLLEAGSSKRMMALVCVGWYWLFGLSFECPIIWKASCPLSVVDLISLKLIFNSWASLWDLSLCKKSDCKHYFAILNEPLQHKQTHSCRHFWHLHTPFSLNFPSLLVIPGGFKKKKNTLHVESTKVRAACLVWRIGPDGFAA